MACSSHSIDPEQHRHDIPITLEDNVWIGANATIYGGVTIRAGSVIGASSAATRDIPAGVIAAGAPCRVTQPITERDKNEPDRILF